MMKLPGRAVVISLVLICTGSGGIASAGPSTDTEPADCHEEGKDLLCRHLSKTLAQFRLESESALLADSPPDVTDIVHCFLDIDLDFVAQTLSGSNTLSITSLLDGLSVLTLDLRSNMVADSVTMGAAPVSFTRSGHTIVINLDRAYAAGETFDVKIDYHGAPQNAGFSSFSWSTHSGAKLVSTLSEPWYAHTWWPCKDRLIDKFTTDFWITVPAGNTAVSNGLLQGIDTLPDNRVRYRWRESYPIATYLVSLNATNYAHWTQYYNHAAGSMPVEFYSYPESQASVQANTSNLVNQIQTFSRPDVFGEYPFIDEKYGIAQFGWSGGMENQTLTSQGVFASWLNAHELSHQWWGDMITCATWHDIWLNEGFATYAEALYEEKRSGGSFSAYLTRLGQRRPGSYGGSVYVYDDTSESAVFSTTNVYNKGAWVLHMLRHVVGDDSFFAALAAYRAAYQGGSATTSDFQAVVETVYGGDLDWFFAEWVYGVGAPSYRYGWREVPAADGSELRLHVEQYHVQFNNFRMPIDVTVTDSAGVQTYKVWQEADVEWYALPVRGPVTKVQFDKDTWILRADAASVNYVPPLQITGLAPAPGQTAALCTPFVEVRFNGPFACTDAEFTVTGSVSGPRPFTTTAMPEANAIRLVFAAPLSTAETWTVQISDNVLSQANGSRLDGEIADPGKPVPTGDGLPGGSAVFSFRTGFSGDFDGDEDVDQEDFGHLQLCLTGTATPQTDPGCLDADLDGDTYVAEQDLLIFEEHAAGAGVAPRSTCGE